MAHKEHRAKRHFIPKTLGGKIGLGVKIIGGVLVMGPAITSVTGVMAKNDWGALPSDLLYNYTGFSTATNTLNTGAATAAVAQVGGGILLIQLGKYLGKAIR